MAKTGGQVEEARQGGQAQSTTEACWTCRRRSRGAGRGARGARIGAAGGPRRVAAPADRPRPGRDSGGAGRDAGARAGADPPRADDRLAVHVLPRRRGDHGGDLSRTPTTGLRVQCCGDAHLSNFGVFAAPDRTLVFDLNDFDETLPAPFEWDVKRLVASLVVAARGNGHRRKEQAPPHAPPPRRIARRWPRRPTMRFLDVWYTRFDAEKVLADLGRDHRQGFDEGRAQGVGQGATRGRAWARCRSSPSAATAATGSSRCRR